MRIVAIGLRGFPHVQGGIENHCEHLYPQLVKLGCEVIVLSRSQYTGKKPYEYKGVKIRPLWSPRNKFLEAFYHTFVGMIIAKINHTNIIHFHAIGPSIFVPFAKMLGMKVVATHHGFDYDRAKWGYVAKAIIKQGERNLCKANQVIAVSKHIQESLKDRLKCQAQYIPNGVDLPEILPEGQFCEKWGVASGKYFFFAGRLVPEKCINDLFEAFDGTNEDWKLVIAGRADHEDTYSRDIIRRAEKIKNVVMTGFITGIELSELFSNAGCFVLPSSHEGLPIALLEALSFGLSCIVSDIPANRSVEHASVHYFPVHNISTLRNLLKQAIEHLLADDRNNARAYVSNCFNWEDIAKKTFDVLVQT